LYRTIATSCLGASDENIPPVVNPLIKLQALFTNNALQKEDSQLRAIVDIAGKRSIYKAATALMSVALINLTADYNSAPREQTKAVQQLPNTHAHRFKTSYS
jgi:hypothetical protein